MANKVNVDFVTKVVEIECNDNEAESLAALAAINAAERAEEAKSVVVTNLNASLATLDNKTDEEKAEIDAYTEAKKAEVNTQAQAAMQTYVDAAAASAAEAAAAAEGVASLAETGVDTSLSVTGAAADAKTVGDEIKKTKAEMELFGVNDLFWDNYVDPTISSQGVTYTIDRTNKKITVSGATTTSVSFCRFYYNKTEIPSWLQKEKPYLFRLFNNTGAYFQVYWYDANETSHTLATIGNEAIVKIPAEASGLMMRIYFGENTSVSGVLRPSISEAPSLYNTFVERGTIYAGGSFDEKTENGFYFVSTNPTVTPDHESNPLDGVSGVLIVYSHRVGAITQVAISLRGKEYVRRRLTDETWTDWRAIADDENSQTYKRIENGSDLDDITTSGFYYLSYGSGYSYDHNPLDNTHGGLLQVFKTGQVVTQIVYSIRRNARFIRNFFNGVWADWAESSTSNLESSPVPLKILFIGHSTVEDHAEYAPFIVHNVAPEIKLTMGVTYYSGASIQDQINFFDNDTLLSRVSMYHPDSTAWTIYSGNNAKTLKYALRAEKWDVIVLAPTGMQTNAPDYNKVGQLLDRIISYVCVDDPENNYEGHPFKLGFIATQTRWAKNDNPNDNQEITGIHPNELDGTAYANVVANMRNALNMWPAEFWIPGATAFWNARGTTLDQYGNAAFNGVHYGHMIADYVHYQEGIGCYVGGLTTALKIMELAGVRGKSVLGENTRPDLAWVTSHNIPGKNYGSGSAEVVGISDANCLVAQKCAIAAVKNPFEVSDIN